MKKKGLWIVTAVTAAMTAGLILYSCGNNDDNAGTTGTVSLYLTDDMSLYTQVTATIDRVQLISTGTGTTCDVFIGPETVNIANLANLMQLMDVRDCPDGPFNRIHIEFDRSVELLSGATGTPASCSFVSYKDEGRNNQPNVLQCDAATNVCVLDVNGAVNVLARQNHKLALDFRLKDFDVAGFGTPACEVTMKVSPLNSSQMQALKNQEAITGFISGLNTTDREFDLTARNRTYHVLYSGITTTDQPGLDTLLLRAQADRLRAKVLSSVIEPDSPIIALKILVKVEGTVSNLVTGATFSVNYGPGGTGNISIDYSKATVSGTIADGSWVDVKMIGYSGADGLFIAGKVEVETVGTMTLD